MQSKPILFIAPYRQIYELAMEISDQYNDVQVELAYLDQAFQVAQKAVEKGVEVIISRGGTFMNLEKKGVQVPLVEIPIDPFDVLHAVDKAKKIGNNVGIIGFANVIRGAERLGPILDLNASTYLINNEKEAAQCLEEAIKLGVNVVLGGSLAEKLALERGIPSVSLETSADGVENSIAQARKIIFVKRQEKIRAEQYKAILDYINEGIIAVNKNLEITLFNHAAEKIVGLTQDEVLGKRIDEIIGSNHLSDVVALDTPRLGYLQTFRSSQVLTNSVSINVNGEVAGAVVTIQNIKKIQEYESTIRAHLVKKGHIAKYTFHDILGKSPALVATKKIAAQYSQVESTVLITGESGTGKEMFAQSIHSMSSRRDEPFIAINCAAIPSNLLESELFGYVSGAFSGARKEGKLGLFALANRGTIFLDEIGEIPNELQARLLRVLQEKEIRPIGSDCVIPVDVRVIAATNKSLSDEVNANRFRKDLYYRLNILSLRIPNLSARKEDIAILCNYFINRYSFQLHKKITISSDTLKVLEEYPWPGNIRELQNTMERLVVTCEDQTIQPKHIWGFLDEPASGIPDEKPLKNIRRVLVRDTLDQCQGNRTLAAKQLGISRVQLWRYLKEDRPD